MPRAAASERSEQRSNASAASNDGRAKPSEAERSEAEYQLPKLAEGFFHRPTLRFYIYIFVYSATANNFAPWRLEALLSQQAISP